MISTVTKISTTQTMIQSHCVKQRVSSYWMMYILLHVLLVFIICVSFVRAQDGEESGGPYYEVVAYTSNNCVTGNLLDDSSMYLDIFTQVNPSFVTILPDTPVPTPMEVVTITTETSHGGKGGSQIISRIEQPMSCKKADVPKKSEKMDKSDGSRRQLRKHPQWQRRDRRGSCPATCQSQNPDLSLCVMVGCASSSSGSARRRFLFRREPCPCSLTPEPRVEADVEATIQALNDAAGERNYCEDLPEDECKVFLDVQQFE